MIQAEILSDMQSSCLLVHEPTGREADYREKMLMYNRIKGIPAFSVRLLDDCRQYCYDITGYEKLLTKYENKKLNRETAGDILLNLIAIINAGKEYLLDEDDFVVDAEYMYSGLDGEIYICYLPGFKQDLKSQISNFLEYLMDKVDYNDKEAVCYIYSIYMRSKEPGCNFAHMLELICSTEAEKKEVKREVNTERDTEENCRTDNNINNHSVQPAQPLAKPDRPVVTGIKGFINKYIRGASNTNIKKGASRSVLPSAGILENATTEKTELLVKNKYDTMYTMVPADKGDIEAIYINRFPFYIGKAKANTDFCIPDASVSRIHCRILAESGRCYIEDLCSLNGTYVNTKRLRDSEKIELTVGDEILLAGKRYIFQ